MKSVLFDKHEGIRTADLPIPQLEPGDVLLRTLVCGVCGTDLLKINNGLIQNPTVLGHELVGEVVDKGEGDNPFELGDRVIVAHHVPCGQCHFCKRGSISMCRSFKSSNLDPGGFSEFVRVPASHTRTVAFKMPEHLSLEDAMFVEPLACCVRNFHRLNVRPGDGVLIVGLGSIGLIMALLFQAKDIDVVGLDLKPERIALAKQLGIEKAFRPDEADVQTSLNGFSAGAADGIVFTAGNSTTLSQALDWVRDGGVFNLFCDLPLDPKGKDGVNLAALYHREINLITTYSASPESLAESFDLIASGAVRLSPLVTHRYGLDEVAKAVQDLNSLKALKAMVVPAGAS